MNSPRVPPFASRSLTSCLAAAVVAGAVTVALPGCGTDARAVARTTTTSAPGEARSRRAASRTVDNAGFVDNAGRTSSETSRTQMSGMRATETGSERPTGTPSSGAMVPPLDGSRGVPNQGEGAGAASSVRGSEAIQQTGAPDDAVVGRIARARCDHATTCGRVASGRISGAGGSGASSPASAPVGSEHPVHASEASCMSHERALTQTDVARTQCASGIDTVQLAACLTAIRGQGCDSPLGALEDVPECRASALCMPR